MSTIRVYVQPPQQQHVSPRRVRPFEAVNTILSNLGWFGNEGTAVPLQGGQSFDRRPTEADLKYLWHNRKLLVQNQAAGVSCNYHLALDGLFAVIRNADGYISRLRAQHQQTTPRLVESPGDMKVVLGKLMEVFYATQIIEDLLLNAQAMKSTAFDPAAEHAQLVMDFTTKLQCFLINDFEGAPAASANERVLRKFVQLVKLLIGLQWYLLRAFVPISCVAILRYLKGTAFKLATLSTDMFRWFNVISSSALQHLLSGTNNEFHNADEIAGSFIVDIMCKVQFEQPQFLLLLARAQRASDLPQIITEELFLVCRSVFLIVRQLCGHPGIAFSKPPYAASRDLKFGETHQRKVRVVVHDMLATLLTGAAKEGPAANMSVLHLFAAAAIGATELLEPFFASFGGQDIVAQPPKDAAAASADTTEGEAVAPRAASTMLNPETALMSVMRTTAAPAGFLPRAVLLAFGMSVPDVYLDTLPTERRTAILSGVLRGFVLHVMQEPAFAENQVAKIQPLHPMIFSYIVPLLSRYVGASADASSNELAHQVLRAYDAVGAHIVKVLSEFGNVAPSSNFRKHTLDIWQTAVSLTSNIVRNPALGSDDAALIIELLSKLYPAYHMHTVLNSTPNSKQQSQRKAQEYTLLKGLLREAMVHCVAGEAAVERVVGTAHQLAASEGFGKSFACTQQVHVYALALGSIEASKTLSVRHLVKHTIPVALACLRCNGSPSVRLVGHDALVAPILAKHRASVVIVPSYVNIFAPTAQVKAPPISLLNIFSRFVRGVCQSVEQCEALDATLSDDDRKQLGPELDEQDLSSVKGLGAALHVIQAVYDNACRYSDTQVPTQDTSTRKKYYISSLINTTQCSDPHVLSRACASIESLLAAKIRNPAEQDYWLGYAHKVVQQSVNYSTKKDLTEWLVTLEEKIKAQRAAGPVMMSKL